MQDLAHQGLKHFLPLSRPYRHLHALCKRVYIYIQQIYIYIYVSKHYIDLFFSIGVFIDDVVYTCIQMIST